MTDQTPPTDPASHPTPEAPDAPYDVVVLVEQVLTPGDAARITSLHEGLTAEHGARVRYHLLLPVDDGAAQVQAALGSFAATDALAAPAPPEQVSAVAASVREEAEQRLAASVGALVAAGADAEGATVAEPPVDALRTTVSQLGAEEAVVLTGRHTLAELVGVDWGSRAQRHLGIPVLHLVEQEAFSEQSGGAEGVTGL